MKKEERVGGIRWVGGWVEFLRKVRLADLGRVGEVVEGKESRL